MSLLTVILVLAMLLWAVGFVTVGLVLAEEVLWRRPAGVGSPPVSRTRKVAAVLLFVIGGILVMTAIVTGVLVAEREGRLVRLDAAVSQLEGKVGTLESKLSHELSNLRRPPAKSR
jgi:hypothetical protein